MAFSSISRVGSHPSPQFLPLGWIFSLQDSLSLEILLSDCGQLNSQILCMLSLRMIQFQRNLGCIGLQNVVEAKKQARPEGILALYKGMLTLFQVIQRSLLQQTFSFEFPIKSSCDLSADNVVAVFLFKADAVLFLCALMLSGRSLWMGLNSVPQL